MTRLVLKSKKEYLIEDGKPLNETRIKVKNVNEFADVFNSLTKAELSDFTIRNDDAILGKYHLFECHSATYENKVGTFHIVAVGTEKKPSIITITETVSDEYSEAGKILLGEEV